MILVVVVVDEEDDGDDGDDWCWEMVNSCSGFVVRNGRVEFDLDFRLVVEGY